MERSPAKYTSYQTTHLALVKRRKEFKDSSECSVIARTETAKNSKSQKLINMLANKDSKENRKLECFQDEDASIKSDVTEVLTLPKQTLSSKYTKGWKRLRSSGSKTEPSLGSQMLKRICPFL